MELWNIPLLPLWCLGGMCQARSGVEISTLLQSDNRTCIASILVILGKKLLIPSLRGNRVGFSLGNGAVVGMDKSCGLRGRKLPRSGEKLN
ncbi:hypothetical protein [[Phormidium] sp. ETS-05]|uniref:hypothetical protein n=1 Tax=[Phormidium] sp. ETS-05 TaxID=222819 RepID=UPI0018EF1721|nr:hypothetical protein [[Phormidium] sp. ETS-05]